MCFQNIFELSGARAYEFPDRARAAGRVYAIEPGPSTVAVLRVNVERNRCGNVVVCEVAAWSARGRLVLKVLHPDVWLRLRRAGGRERNRGRFDPRRYFAG